MFVADEQTFAARLKAIRLNTGISQYELAKRSGLTKQSISSLEKGDNAPSWDTVKKLARGLGVPVQAFDPPSDVLPLTEPDSDPEPPAPLPRPVSSKRK